MLLNCGVGELLRVPWTARRSKQSILKEISPECSLEDWCWSWNSNALATWFEEFTHFKRPWCWERLRTGREGDNRGWMSSLTQWTWVCINSGSWWWTRRPGVRWFMGLQRVRHDWATELNHYQTSFTTKVKGTSIGRKHKRRERPTKTNPKQSRKCQ